MNSERKTVTVVEGSAEPRFVLEFENRVYVTLGVLEYDPAKKTMDEEERADLAELQAMLKGPRRVSGTVFGGPREVAAMAQSQSRDR